MSNLFKIKYILLKHILNILREYIRNIMHGMYILKYFKHRYFVSINKLYIVINNQFKNRNIFFYILFPVVINAKIKRL